MTVYILTKGEHYEGDKTLGVISSEKLPEYLAANPAFVDDNGGYTTYTKASDNDWYDLTPWEVDGEIAV
jgi:hypothetical protein